jgi:hypothetical protein
MTLRRIVLISFLLLIPFTAHSQEAPIQNPQAIALARQALAALDGSVQVNDITLAGIGTRTAGSDIEAGSASLKALGTLDSRLDLVLTNGNCSEIRNQANGASQGFWIGPDGTVNSMANHNVLTDAAWFFPPLTVLSQVSNQNLSVIYVGPDTKNGVAVQHVQFVTQFPAMSPGAGELLSSLTTTDMYLNASSFLPVAICFSTHPDNDAGTNIPVEVDFSNYQSVSGVQIPFHIQKFLNGTLYLDLTVQNAILNSGLTDSNFAVN